MKQAEIHEGGKGLIERVLEAMLWGHVLCRPAGYFGSCTRSILAACDGVEILPQYQRWRPQRQVLGFRLFLAVSLRSTVELDTTQTSYSLTRAIPPTCTY